MFSRLSVFAAVSVAAMLCAASPSSAATVSCAGDRVFSVTITGSASCLQTGEGNISGNSQGANPDPLTQLGEGVALLEIGVGMHPA